MNERRRENIDKNKKWKHKNKKMNKLMTINK